MTIRPDASILHFGSQSLAASARRTTADYSYRHFGGLRLLLAALVMLQHYAADLAPAPLARALAPFPFGSMAVLVFFAMSGFVITEAADRVYRERARAFMANRLLRILPHFMLAVGLSMLAHGLFHAAGGVRLWRSQPSFPQDAFDPLNIVLNFIGVLPAVDRFIDYNFLDITWAVRVEMAFYFVVAGCLAIGSKLPGQWGFGRALSMALLPLGLLFLLAMRGHGISMLVFLPYFVFGSGLYFATAGQRGGWLAVAMSIPAMLWHGLTQQPTSPMPDAPMPSMFGDLITLGLLLGCFAVLAFCNITHGRNVDRFLGRLTYPLYLYHEVVLVLLLTFTTGYSYGMFAIGMLLSLLAALALGMLVDPLIDRFRDKVRGGVL